ncbi:hypothetical protein DSM00_2479 [Leeuwenhoekiella aequorea]|uniref:Uncharacterized protein n=1 Tax=Leeuwenhoekiella aequorea TaxID=283736 RepID=A0A4Q0P4V0_9FLAO|nr:hypothetical protein DSM00_2479 [Leeuwenhoekiella aequorea]
MCSFLDFKRQISEIFYQMLFKLNFKKFLIKLIVSRYQFFLVYLFIDTVSLQI